jgi:hypothetical protein
MFLGGTFHEMERGRYSNDTGPFERAERDIKAQLARLAADVEDKKRRREGSRFVRQSKWASQTERDTSVTGNSPSPPSSSSRASEERVCRGAKAYDDVDVDIAFHCYKGGSPGEKEDCSTTQKHQSHTEVHEIGGAAAISIFEGQGGGGRAGTSAEAYARAHTQRVTARKGVGVTTLSGRGPCRSIAPCLFPGGDSITVEYVSGQPPAVGICTSLLDVADLIHTVDHCVAWGWRDGRARLGAGLTARGGASSHFHLVEIEVTS